MFWCRFFFRFHGRKVRFLQSDPSGHYAAGRYYFDFMGLVRKASEDEKNITDLYTMNIRNVVNKFESLAQTKQCATKKRRQKILRITASPSPNGRCFHIRRPGTSRRLECSLYTHSFNFNAFPLVHFMSRGGK